MTMSVLTLDCEVCMMFPVYVKCLPPAPPVSETRYVELLARFGGRMDIKECGICNGKHSAMREHCPFCGARNYFIASHSYEPLKTQQTYRDSASGMKREMIRAYFSKEYAWREHKMDVRDCDGDRALI